MVSPHPNCDVQMKKINTITLFHAFLKKFKFGRFEVSTLYIQLIRYKNRYKIDIKWTNRWADRQKIVSQIDVHTSLYLI